MVKKKYTLKHLVGVLVITVVICGAGVVFANVGGMNTFTGPVTIYQGIGEKVNDAVMGAVSWIAPATGFTDVNITNDLKVDGDLEVDTTSQFNATTTLQEVTYGSRYSKALTFTAGATSTPGGLFSLQNTGDTKICDRVELEITTALTAAYEFSVTTSTSATAYSANGQLALLASSTAATDTVALFNNVDNIGGNVQDSWLWGRGEYIIGCFDKDRDDGVCNSATSTATDYTSAVGKFYVQCHTR